MLELRVGGPGIGDAQLVDEAALKASGAFGVVRSGRIVQVIVGPEADNLAAELDSLRADGIIT